MKYILAPLAGYTDAAFRRLAHECGADLTYTEMVSAAGLAHGSRPTRHLMHVLPGEGPVACQLFGSDPGELAFAAHEAEATGNFVAIDLNAGCPVPKVTREGAGSALITDPGKVYALLAAMKRSTSLPITLKTRPGPRPDRIVMKELLSAAESAGACAITLHARFTSAGHGGPARLDLLAELVAAAKIPVVGNGGVVDRKSASEMAATGVDAIMIGRAALGNPGIFALVKAADAPHRYGRRETIERHLAAIAELNSSLRAAFPGDRFPSLDAASSVAMHTHLFRYFSGLPGAAEVRRRLNSIRTLAEIRELVACIPPGVLL